MLYNSKINLWHWLLKGAYLRVPIRTEEETEWKKSRRKKPPHIFLPVNFQWLIFLPPGTKSLNLHAALSVTRLCELLDFGQDFKAFGSN